MAYLPPSYSSLLDELESDLDAHISMLDRIDDMHVILEPRRLTVPAPICSYGFSDKHLEKKQSDGRQIPVLSFWSIVLAWFRPKSKFKRIENRFNSPYKYFRSKR